MRRELDTKTKAKLQEAILELAAKGLVEIEYDSAHPGDLEHATIHRTPASGPVGPHT